jgi:hypothetical protein
LNGERLCFVAAIGAKRQMKDSPTLISSELVEVAIGSTLLTVAPVTVCMPPEEISAETQRAN